MQLITQDRPILLVCGIRRGPAEDQELDIPARDGPGVTARCGLVLPTAQPMDEGPPHRCRVPPWDMVHARPLPVHPGEIMSEGVAPWLLRALVFQDCDPMLQVRLDARERDAG